MKNSLIVSIIMCISSIIGKNGSFADQRLHITIQCRIIYVLIVVQCPLALQTESQCLANNILSYLVAYAIATL